MPPRELPPGASAYFALLEVSALLHHELEQQAREDAGITFVQFQILAALSEHPEGSRTMTDVADQIVHSRSGLTYQAQKLEEAGYLTRGPAPGDERSTMATLTPAGREVLAGVLPGHLGVVRELFLDPLATEDTDELTRVLDLVRTHMRGRPPRSAARRSRRPETK
ncbi:MarR family winged helix-turn-helix transcriptional regulator [Kineosporia succinea]|uniref:DNA-binding MarR family transcriptional regulator n=1 Tax=Kineosporia succinea TaxID=84632 RepID=A0ABT9P4B8_9ACTN|nr:MarR family winged helix-turn-helix transcriptional regulator [Kineosporia succinea]MDP9826910.1 DNA-binding MarR family transcriptional regulator [Kineosporia succinea]